MRRTSIYEANVQGYLAADESTRKELIDDAEWNLTARIQTANVSYIGGVLFAGIAASLLIAMYDKQPWFAASTFGVSVMAIVIGILPALSELFRRVPTELQSTISRSAEQLKPERIQAERYAQTKQRVYHLQRNTFRFRWSLALAGLLLIAGIVAVLWP